MLYLKLFHGRKDPKQDMDEFGEQGPIFGPLVFGHTTYNSEIKIRYEGQEITGDCFVLQIIDDMVYYNGWYYGDWSFFPSEVAIKEWEGIMKKLVTFKLFNESLTKPTITLNQEEFEEVLMYGMSLDYLGIDPSNFSDTAIEAWHKVKDQNPKVEDKEILAAFYSIYMEQYGKKFVWVDGYIRSHFNFETS